MRKSNFGSSTGQRHSILKPRNTDHTPNSGQHAKRKLRSSSESGNVRLSQITGRYTPTSSKIPRFTPVRNDGGPSTLTAPPSCSSSRQSDSNAGSKNRKETRPIGDSAFKSECIDKVLDFLATNGCDYQVNRRVLLNPTSKDFTNIFAFIYRFFDPSYTLPNKFEEEIPRLLKLLKYPTQMPKSSFMSVGSRHTWPAVLAMLTWLIDGISIYNTTDSFSAMYPADFNIESTVNEKRIAKFFDMYYCGDNSDMIEEHYADYGHNIEAVYEVRVQDMIKHQELSEKIDEEIARLSSGPERLEHLNQQYEMLVNDKEKMVSYNRELQVHFSAKDTERAQLEAKLGEHKAQLMKISEEQSCLEVFKAQQGLSAGELARFKNHAKDVATLIAQLQSQGKDLASQVWTLEMSQGKAHKELSDKIACFNATVRQMDLSIDIALDAGNIDVSLWKTSVLGDLYECKKNVKRSAYEAQNQKLRKEQDLTTVQESLKEKKDQMVKLETKLRRVEEDIALTKNEILAEEKEMQQENDRSHQQIVEARKGRKTNLYQKQNSLDQAKKELEATKSLGKERMRAGAEFLVKVCHCVIEDMDMKTNITSKLKYKVEKTCKEALESIKGKGV